MTRPTSLSRELPQLTHRLGSVFPAPASLSSNTIDRAAGLDVFVPPSSANIALVQSKTDQTGGSITFDDTATGGNLLIYSVAPRGGSGDPTTPDGWTAHPDGSIGSFGMFYKVADGTETDVASTVTGSSGIVGGFSEWSGVSALADSGETSGTGTALVGPAVTPTAGTEALIVGAFSEVRPGDAGQSAAPTAPWLELHDSTLAGGFSPLLWSVYQIVASASGSYTPTGTSEAGVGLPYSAQTLAFSRSSAPVQGGPNATDGDASTYVSTSSTVDIDLGDRYEIVRSNARIATASGGSRTFTIYGANVADFSDAVALDTTTFTASGSFIAQNISFSCARGQSFRYYRLENTVEAWRLHTWELYEPTVGDTHDHDFIPESTFDARGDLLVGTGSDTYARKGSVSSNVYSLQTRQDGDIEWQPFVRSIVSNGSNTLQRPDIAVQAGTGIALGVSSNTLTITSTVSSGSSGSVELSYSATAEDVAATGDDGTSTDVSRGDHVHKGVLAVAHASNTFSGTVTLTTPGNTVGITSPTPGTFALTASGGAPAAGGGGGGLTQAYVGYNTIGGTWETMTNVRVYAKKVTLANDCLLTNIAAYVRNRTAASDDSVSSLSVAVYDDAAGTPDVVIGYVLNPATSVLMDDAAGAGGDGTGRWLGVPLGLWLPAGDYWIAVGAMPNSNAAIEIAYDATGADRFYTSGSSWFADWGWYSPTTSANEYSIRGNTIR